MRKIEVLGIPMRDFTMRESMRKIDRFFGSGSVGTIALITMTGVIAAQDSEEIKAWVKSLDMTIPMDADILRAADINSRSRISDVENDVFIREFLKRLVRQRKKLYLLSGTEQGLNKLERDLRSFEENLRIVGRMAVGGVEYEDDFIINDINNKEASVLISNLESPMRESFMENNHMKMNLDVWLMVRADQELKGREKSVFAVFYDKLVQRWFHARLSRYEEEKQAEETKN